MSERAPYLESLAEIAYRLESGRIKSRPTVYGGIAFRSRLEVRFAWHLDALGLRWTYEPRPYGSGANGYLPDFRLDDADVPTFIEVKPTLAEAHPALEKMSVIWDEHPNATLIVAVEEGATYFARSSGGPIVRWTDRWSA